MLGLILDSCRGPVQKSVTEEKSDGAAAFQANPESAATAEPERAPASFPAPSDGLETPRGSRGKWPDSFSPIAGEAATAVATQAGAAPRLQIRLDLFRLAAGSTKSSGRARGNDVAPSQGPHQPDQGVALPPAVGNPDPPKEPLVAVADGDSKEKKSINGRAAASGEIALKGAPQQDPAPVEMAARTLSALPPVVEALQGAPVQENRRHSAATAEPAESSRLGAAAIASRGEASGDDETARVASTKPTAPAGELAFAALVRPVAMKKAAVDEAARSDISVGAPRPAVKAPAAPSQPESEKSVPKSAAGAEDAERPVVHAAAQARHGETPEGGAIAAPAAAAASTAQTAPVVNVAAAQPGPPRNETSASAPAPATRSAAPPTPAAAPQKPGTLQFQLEGGGQRVQVRVEERAGELRVAVHTPDSHLAGALREDLPTLAAKLEQGGFRADTWHTGVERQRAPEAASGEAASQEGSTPQHQEHQQDEDPRQNRAKTNDQESQSNPERKDFSWLFTSIT